MIESIHWKKDLLRYSKQFSPVLIPRRWSEKRQVNFEKDVIIAFFMIRKLIESTKFSSKTTKYKAKIFRSPCIGKVNNLNFWDIDELYDLDKEQPVTKGVNFLCNQLIHGGAVFAYREKNRNWGGIYTCSDFEREKYVYKIPITEIVKILEVAGNDYPTDIFMTYSDSKNDYVVKTN